MTTLFASVGLKRVLAFLAVLGPLVFVHELGHFIVARLHGVKVLTFSLGFGPKLFRLRRGDTEYCISAVPLGGYVKLAGESVEDTRTGAPDEFMSKSKWVRFQVYLAGPVMNLLVAVLVLAGVLAQGAYVEAYRSAPAVVGSIIPTGAAEAAGLQAGDRIISVAGTETPTWDDMEMAIATRPNREVAIVAERGGQRLSVRPTLQMKRSMGVFEVGVLGVGPVLRPQIGEEITSGGPADLAGFKGGDVIVAVDGTPRLTEAEVRSRIQGAKGPLTFTLERNGRAIDLTATPANGLIGVKLQSQEVLHIDPTFFQAVGLSVQENWKATQQIGSTLKGLFTRETSVKQLSGPVGIATLVEQAARFGWLTFFEVMAMISLNLGLLNLLPVPVLDGGQIAILAVEGVSRRDLSMKVKERILIAGVALIALLMVTVMFNDIARLLR